MSMLIRLENEGVVLEEIEADDITAEIVIGRAGDCTWAVGERDATVGRQHVSIQRRGRKVVLRDLGSRNGTFYRGREIKKIDLKPGVNVSFGKCVVRVAKSRKTAAAAKGVPQLSVHSGKSRGSKVDITAGTFTIGSDPDSSLVLLDDLLVSRRHAEVALRDDGSCWIKDLNSSNGTKVNDQALKVEQERLLQHGDRIQIAHVDLRYRDGVSGGEDVKVWIRLGIMAATVALAVGAYWAYLHIRRPASSFFDEARELAGEQAFEEARAALRDAENSRGIKEYSVKAQELRRLLAIWESTVETWAKTQDVLAEGDWVQASRSLASLVGRQKESWMWDEGGAGIDMRAEVQGVKDILDSYLTASASLKRLDVSEAGMRKRHEGLQSVLASAGEAPATYLEPLYGAMGQCAKDIEALLGDYRGLDDALASLGKWPPRLEKVLKTVENAYRSADRESVKKRASQLLPPLRGLQIGMKALGEKLRLVHAGRPDEALGIEIKLPSADMCSVDERLSATRASMSAYLEVLRRQTVTLASFLREAEAAMAKGGECFDQGRHWRDEQVMGKVFGCDTLDLPYPSRTRSAPSGEFDRYLGAEEFFEYLRARGNMTGSDLWSDAKFTTLLGASANALARVAELTRFVDSQEDKQFLDGELAARVEQMRAVLTARDLIVKDMLERAGREDGRRALVAAGIAMRLSTKPDQVEVAGKKATDWIADNLKKLRTDLMKMNTTYNYVGPSKQIEARDEVLRTGLPGDPIVKRMWVARSAVAAE